MRDLSNNTGSISYSETRGENGDFAAPIAGKEFYKDLIRQANTVPLVRIFKHYGLRLDENNKKCICPFTSHNGGRENSASFNFYPQTNTFWCFGCKTGIGGTDFIAAMENITKVKAAYKIIDLFSSDVDPDGVLTTQDFSERLEIMMDFSNSVREFRRINIDKKASEFIENICLVYDTVNLKHDLNNEALRSVVTKLKEEIISYKPCLTL